MTKKLMLIVGIVVMLALSACSPTDVDECVQLANGKQACFKGVVSINEPSASATASPTVDPSGTPIVAAATTVPTAVSEDTVVSFGKSGSFHAVKDTVIGQWTLGMWETSRVDAGWTLAELKKNGDSFEFVMPFDAVINQSAGKIFINDVQWNLGNPSVGPDMITKVIPAGAKVKIDFAGSDSDGIQIWFINK